MAIVQILEQFDFTNYPSDGWWILLEPATEDLKLKLLNLKCNPGYVHGGAGLGRWARPEEESNESPDNYAEKVYEAEWAAPHWRLDLYQFGKGKEVLINSLPIVNRGFPYDRDLIFNTSTAAGVLELEQGFGLKCKFVDNGYGLPEQINGQFIAIFGIGQIGTDQFTTPRINIDATTSVTNTADGKTIKEGILPTGDWQLSAKEQSPYRDWNHGDLIPIIDGNPDTKWQSTVNLADSKITLTIHLGKEYQVNGLKIKTGDIPNMAKGTIFTSTDMQEWRSVGHFGFLDGDINFAKRAARWIRLETSSNINVGYEKWWLYGISVYGDITQESGTATNPVISAFNWLVKHIRYGNTANTLPNLTAAPIVEEGDSDSYAKIEADSSSLPQLHYSPFMKAFASESTGLSASQKMGQEYVGIEIDLGKNYDVELIDAQFSTTPKQWRGFLIGSKDYQTWITLASGFVSELKSQAINFTQCRFLRIINDASGNHANGLSTPPILNKFDIYAALSMQQIEPVTQPTEPTAYLNAEIKLDLSGDASGALINTSGFSLVSGGVAPTLVEEGGKKHISWRYPNNSTNMHLIHSEASIRAILAEIKSPTDFWGYKNQSWWAQDGFFGVINPQIEIYRTKVERVLRNGEEILSPYDLAPINEWFWVFIEFNEVINAEWMLGRAVLSNWRNDIDIRHFLAWENTPSDSEVDEVIQYFGG
ncbi:discoidin domain-containing protein [Roseofilum sp. Belize Diploria]|uniref:discoidin domain-containing protein n=1 Tax=Roseofilum sp. Belize Diploria TaxID=2821501 RepID=UPI001B11547D|nr:discoidin domain-containing protein [Roseofilum sp. Belize Diploria]MBP0011335.1 discoidin domain-containing protein [Roseofilum sp. Belize Diploria]